MGDLYNIAAALGVAAAYVHAAIALFLAILCVSVGSTFVRSPQPEGDVVEATVTEVTKGCSEVGPCTVTVAYTYNGKEYTSTFGAFLSYAVGDSLGVRISPTNPKQVSQEYPRRALGWLMLGCAVLTVALAYGLLNFATDSKNFAAATGAFAFFQALL